MSSLEFFLLNPELKKRHELALPTEEMYRYIPSQSEIYTVIDPNDPKVNSRSIYNGLPKNSFEQQKLPEFINFLKKKGDINFPDSWLESDTHRFLQSTDYNFENAYKKIKETTENINKDPKTISNRIIELLNSGFIYMHGRDHKFHPIIVFEMRIAVEYLNKKGYSKEEIAQCAIFLMNYIIKYMFIPGQIENYTLMIDLKDIGLSDFGVSKAVITVLDKRYPGRVYRNFLLNLGGFIRTAVKGALSVLGKSSSRKLRLYGKDEFHKLNEVIRPDNIQQKYGGTAPNVVYGGNNLFPPIVPSQKYQLDGEKSNVISPEEYKEMCINSNPYKPFVICPYYENLWKQEQNNKNNNFNNNINNVNNIIGNGIPIQNSILMQNTLMLQNRISINNKHGRRSGSGIKMSNTMFGERNGYARTMNNGVINEFVLEFEKVNKYDNEKSNHFCNVPRAINVREISSFFNKIRNNQNFFKIPH